MINILRRMVRRMVGRINIFRRKGGKAHYIFSEKVRIFLKEDGRWGGRLYFQDFQAKSLGTYFSPKKYNEPFLK